MIGRVWRLNRYLKREEWSWNSNFVEGHDWLKHGRDNDTHVNVPSVTERVLDISYVEPFALTPTHFFGHKRLRVYGMKIDGLIGNPLLIANPPQTRRTVCNTIRYHTTSLTVFGIPYHELTKRERETEEQPESFHMIHQQGHQFLVKLLPLLIFSCGVEWIGAFLRSPSCSLGESRSLLCASSSSQPYRRHHCPSGSGISMTKRLSSTSATVTSPNILFWPEQQHDRADNKNIDGTDNEDDKEGDPREAKLLQVLDSILKVHCTHSEPDYLIPWQKQHQTMSTSSGFVIEIPSTGERTVMTNAHSVEYGSIVQVQRRGGELKYEATIRVIANECDLALLDVEDEEFWKDLEPLEFGALPALQQDVEVLGYPTGGDSLSITQGVVSRIEMQEYSQASTHLLAIQIDAAINAGNSG